MIYSRHTQIKSTLVDTGAEYYFVVGAVFLVLFNVYYTKTKGLRAFLWKWLANNILVAKIHSRLLIFHSTIPFHSPHAQPFSIFSDDKILSVLVKL